MSAERVVGLALALALVASALSPARAQPVATTAPTFDRAMADYELQRCAPAFEALADLADAGHRDAARIALLMLAHGPRLYGQRFEADPARRVRWVDAATSLPLVATPRP